MKREKFKNGHQFHYNNCWYNFCVKCLETKFNKPCLIEGDANLFTSFHKIDFKNGIFHCDKCDLISSFTQKYFEQDELVYLENKQDRLIERFYCGDFLPPKNSKVIIGKIKLPCWMTEDEYLIKTIII